MFVSDFFLQIKKTTKLSGNVQSECQKFWM